MAGRNTRYKGNNGSKIFIDFTGLEFPTGNDKGRWTAFQKHHEGKAHDPHYNLLGKTLMYPTPEELQERVNQYFETCYGPALNKVGNILYLNGEPVITQTQPFTRFGLILFLGMSETTYYNYINISESGDRDPRYAEILRAAQMKIDAQAERLLYDRDSGRGAEFYLKAFRKMTTKKEDAEIRRLNAQRELARDEFELKKQLLGDDASDTELVVEVVRKRQREEN